MVRKENLIFINAKFRSLDLGLWVGGARRALGADYLLSMWVYMDDLDTSKNIISVCISFIP